MYGSRAYHAAHPGDGDGLATEKFIFVSESDEGVFRPTSWRAQMQTFGTPAQRYLVSYLLAMVNLNGIPISMTPTTAGAPHPPLI